MSCKLDEMDFGQCDLTQISMQSLVKCANVSYLHVKKNPNLDSIAGDSFLMMKELRVILFDGKYDEFRNLVKVRPFTKKVTNFKFGHRKPVILITFEEDGISEININRNWMTLG
jgi:hypothetical protein